MSTLPNRLLNTVVALTILVPSISLSQATIKEKVTICAGPNRLGKTSDSNNPPLPTTFSVGGVVELLALPPWVMDTSWQLRVDGDVILEPVESWARCAINVNQWSTKSFSMTTKDVNSVYAGKVFYPQAWSSTLIGRGGAGDALYFNPVFPDSSQYWFAYSMTLYPDSSEAMPPQWYLEYEYGPGNPYDKTLAPTVEVPFDMTYRIIIDQVKASATDDLVMTSPTTQLLVRNVANHWGDTVVVGPFARGTPVQLGLVSGIGTLVKGDTLYPVMLDYGDATWWFKFEDWTDLDFNDVVVHLEPNSGMPDHLELWSTTSTVYYGDTVDVAIVPVDKDSLFAPLNFDWNYEFSVSLAGETSRYGQLLYGGEGGESFEHIPSEGGKGVEIRFAANGVEPDSSVALTFHLKATYLGGGDGIPMSVEGGVSTKPAQAAGAIHRSLKKQAAPQATGRVGKVLSKTGIETMASRSRSKISAFINDMENEWTWGISPPTEILLGETQYYGAKVVQTKSGASLTIDRATVGNDGVPRLDGAETSAVLYAFSASKNADGAFIENGVYFENMYPVWDQGEFKRMSPLGGGLIRLVGRYWNQEQEHKVVLTASAVKKDKPLATHIYLVVKKPAKLFDPAVFNKPFNTTQNIKGAILNIDSLCIRFGGTIGIPPHVIKGQMFQESDKTGDQFNPSYRYEPWADYGFARGAYAEDYAKQPFWVTGEQPIPMGEGKAVPVDHQNVYPVYYPTNPVSIADYVTNNWERYILLARDSIIGGRDLTKRFREYLKQWRDVWLVPFVGEGPYSVATKLIQRDIRTKYTDYAQTRKAASYGLIQMMYTTARDPLGFNRGRSISTSSAPEELNDETIEMPFYQTFTQRNLRLEFGGDGAIVPEANWPKGWEQTWMDSFVKYNGVSGYSKSVFSHARKFYPQKNQGAL